MVSKVFKMVLRWSIFTDCDGQRLQWSFYKINFAEFSNLIEWFENSICIKGINYLVTDSFPEIIIERLWYTSPYSLKKLPLLLATEHTQ